jgi:hypothetical protein
MSESPEEETEGAAPPQDDLTWCRVVIYTHLVIAAMSPLAAPLDSGRLAVPPYIKEIMLGVLVTSLKLGFFLFPMATIVVLCRLKHASVGFRVGIFFLELVLLFVQVNHILRLV